MAHLSITLDDDLYTLLKRDLPAKRISAFICDAVRAKLRPTREDLDNAYRSAAKEEWRKELAEWSALDGEAWPQ